MKFGLEFKRMRNLKLKKRENTDSIETIGHFMEIFSIFILQCWEQNDKYSMKSNWEKDLLAAE